MNIYNILTQYCYLRVGTIPIRDYLSGATNDSINIHGLKRKMNDIVPVGNPENLIGEHIKEEKITSHLDAERMSSMTKLYKQQFRDCGIKCKRVADEQNQSFCKVVKSGDCTSECDLVGRKYLEQRCENDRDFDSIVDDYFTDNDSSISEIRSEVGMVFQQYNLFPHLTVLQNLTLGPTKA